jgi:hypothetical protein
MEVFMNDQEFSDIEIFQHSGKGIPLFMTGHKIGKVFTNKFVGTRPSSYEKLIYQAAVSQRLRNADVEVT